MLRLDRGARAQTAQRQRQVAKQLAEAAKRANAVVVSDYGAGTIGEEARTLLRKLARDGLPVCVDSRYALEKFTGLTLCKPNEPELQVLTQMAISSERDLIKAGRAGVKQLRCQALLVTRGRNGMALFDSAGKVELIPVHGAKEAVDVTGAGDTVIAALALALGAGAGINDAAALANIAGALVVQKQGTATVARSELLQELGVE